MRSWWIEHRGKKIFFHDFSGLMYDAVALKEKLTAVQADMLQHLNNSLLVLSDFRDTNITSEIMPILNASSPMTKEHFHKAAVNSPGFSLMSL
ncbi:MAG: hypothetical protein WBL25_15605 [Anaerolineales bacterium]